MLKVWVLTVTTVTPGLYTQSDAVALSDWSTERDCRQAEFLEKKIAELRKIPVLTQCQEAGSTGQQQPSKKLRSEESNDADAKGSIKMDGPKEYNRPTMEN